MLSSKCPSCDTPIQLKGEFSTHAVCPHCQSVLSKAGDELKATGEKGALQPDHTLLQIGTLIHYQEQSFEVVGRAQFLHSAGFWNEWHLLDQRGESWWLGEAMGEYFLFQENLEIPTPSRNGLELGQEISLGYYKSTLAAIHSMKVGGFEGELPFFYSLNDEWEHYDFRSEVTTGFLFRVQAQQDQLSTFCQGQWLNFDELKFENIKEAYSNTPNPPQFECPKCHTLIQLYLGNASHSYCCPHCESLLDTSSSEPKLLSQVDGQEDLETPIQPGDLFIHQDISWRCVTIFHKERLTRKGSSPLKEYLFFHSQRGYRWLFCSDNHWVWFKPIPNYPYPYLYLLHREGDRSKRLKHPRPKNTKVHLPGEAATYTYLSSSQVKTVKVLGELPWESSTDHVVGYHDFISYNNTLRLQVDHQQLPWFIGSYLPISDLEQQFPDRTFPPSPQSISPFQPNRYIDLSIKALFLFFSLLIPLFLIALFQTSSKEKVARFAHPIPPLYAPQEKSREFVVEQQGAIELSFQGENFSYDYCSVKAILTHQETQVSYQIEPFLTKKHPRNHFFLRGMPQGRYTLEWSTYQNNYPLSRHNTSQSSLGSGLTVSVFSSSFTPLAFSLALLSMMLLLFHPTTLAKKIEDLRSLSAIDLHGNPISGKWLLPLFTWLIILYSFFKYGADEVGSLSILTSLIMIVLLTQTLYYFDGAKLAQQDQQAILSTKKKALVLILLALFACNSFFGYGFSSTHTKLQVSDIKEPLKAEPYPNEPMSTTPGGGRAF